MNTRSKRLSWIKLKIYKRRSMRSKTFVHVSHGILINYFVKDLPIDNITDIAYAFFNIDETGKTYSGDPWADFDQTFIGKGVEPQNTWDSPPEDLGIIGQFCPL